MTDRDLRIFKAPSSPGAFERGFMDVLGVANDRLINAVQCCFAQMGQPHGLFIGLSGGPGLQGHDDWVTYEGPDGGAMIILDTIEIIEDMYPILVEGRWIEQDTLGAGEWDHVVRR
jgi:N-methylhydantoinase B